MPTGFFDRTQKLHTMADVNRVLAERTGQKSAQDDANLSGLEWLPKVKGVEAILTKCGRYSVSRAAVSGNFAYTAWSRLPSPRPIGEAVYALDLAKELCEGHASRSGT